MKSKCVDLRFLATKFDERSTKKHKKAAEKSLEEMEGLVIQGNALKDKSLKSLVEAEKIEATIKDLIAKRKKLG